MKKTLTQLQTDASDLLLLSQNWHPPRPELPASEERITAQDKGQRGVVYLWVCTLTLALPGSSAATDRAVCSDAGCAPSTLHLPAPPAADTAWREEGRVEAGAEEGAERSSSPLQHCNMAKKERISYHCERHGYRKSVYEHAYPKSSILELFWTFDGDSGGSGMMAPSSGIPGNKNLQQHFLLLNKMIRDLFGT